MPRALPHAWGPPPATGRIRVDAEDFEVEELLGFAPDGAGGHALLTVEKRGANTGWVAGQLAHAAGARVRDVGFSGRKDRRALTRQTFSVPLARGATPAGWLGVAGPGFRVIDAHAHGRKLRIGSHRGNRFRIRVRELAGDAARLEERMHAIMRGGAPNYFGPQRFGRDGANLVAARAWADGVVPRDRAMRGFALSAARSHIYNDVLSRRVERGDWNRLLNGEVVILDGRSSYFRAAAVDAALIARCDALDVHPSGPLWGRGASPATADAAAVEQAAVAREPALAALLADQRLEQQRRSLRLPVRALEWRVDGTVLELRFELPRGAFATAVLHELLSDADVDASDDE